ncbi:nucleotide sugar dehydrogenase [Paenibacillus antarcticus]|uniref:UDP-N-acetyl-D-galactosamine dehydrogenase n=1 Tax=Paenibacillus antarcticus TaxID=253703 RepID=A0A168Q3B8_9BACL|nr:nucleotide sugar dehydrogenase [Paenibacillus antarcticus]OAB47344.1 UDP-N-acetyl-D-galactosamine dehydrogenase [Paenibacillus antarcticus]
MELYENIVELQEKLAVIGLGYVGLPIAVAFSKRVNVIGFDINEQKVNGYRNGIDATGEMMDVDIRDCSVDFTSDVEQLNGVKFFIIAVPTPVQSGNVPDLKYVQSASRIVAKKLTKGAIVVFESTVYPGVTEEICIPILEAESGLRCGEDFKVGYSPERINPGDRVHRLENIVKIVSGIDEEALETIAKVYELVIEAGVYRAESIKVAEAAKVIENAQRDINIAFMNELSMLFNRMGIDTKEVLKAASTKWNFLDFSPGLVGGHCIGIDPYYLTYKAEDIGYHSQIILAGRHINDGMGKFIAQHIIKILVRLKLDLNQARIGLLGLSYKEDSSDIRNTKVTDIIEELQEYGIDPILVDPLVDQGQVYSEYGLEMSTESDLSELNVLILAVAHESFAQMSFEDIDRMYSKGQSKVLIDIKGVYNKAEFESQGYYYWRL